MIYVFGEFEIDARLYVLRCAGEPLKLEPRVLDVLVYLLRARDRIVSKDELIAQVWQGQVITDAALTHCLAKARKAVNDDGDRQLVIKTQHGRGYRFIAEVIERSDAPTSPLQPPSDSGSVPVESLPVDDPLPVTTTEDPAPAPDSSARSQVRSPSSWRKPVLLVAVTVLSGGLALWQFALRATAPVEPEQTPQRRTEASSPVVQLTPPPLSALKPSLAVMPFVNLSGEAQQEPLADGLTEELITALSRISGLFVVARNSVYTYKGKPTKADELGRELGASYVLEGSVRRDGDRVRITAQLVNTLTGYHVWAERYDRPASDLFALQDEITHNIVTTLAVKIKEGEARARRSTENIEAYDYAARPWEQRVRFTQTANTQARQLLEKAIALDPLFTVAHIGLGRTYMLDWLASWDVTAEALDQASRIAQHVLWLDDSLPAARTFMADVYLFQKRHAQAIAEATRAINLDPSFGYAYVSLASVLNCVRRPEEAIGLIVEKAARLDPGGAAYHATVLGHSYFLLRRYTEAEAMLKRTISRNPDYVFAHSLLVAVYVEIGRQSEAEAELTTVVRLSPQISLATARDRTPYQDAADAERMLTAWQKAGLK